MTKSEARFESGICRSGYGRRTPADTPYKPYDPDAERPATQIYVEAPTGKPQEIRLLSDTIVQLRKRYELVRYYFPEGLRTDINAIAEATLRRGQR